MENEIEILDQADPDFNEKLAFALWSTGGSSDYRNDRDRPYNGQSWTDEGERGKTEVKGLTMRDIRDCLIKAMLNSSSLPDNFEDEFDKCWDFSVDPAEPTQYLLDNQDKFLYEKVKLGTWRYQDVYKIDWNKIDPIAICQNMACEIEKMMGIFPNVPDLKFIEDDDLWL